MLTQFFSGHNLDKCGWPFNGHIWSGAVFIIGVNFVPQKKLFLKKKKAQPRKNTDGIFLATALHEMCKQTCLVYQLLGKTNWYGKATDTWIFDVWVYLISPNPIFSFPFFSILMMKNNKSIFWCISLRLMVGLIQLFIYFQLRCAPA